MLLVQGLSNQKLVWKIEGVAPDDVDDWYTTKQVADLLGVTPAAVQKAVKDSRLDGRKIGSGPKAPYRFSRTSIDALDGQMPGGKRRSDDHRLLDLVERLRQEAATHQTERALAEQRIMILEREVDRLQGALQDVVRRFTAPEIPDVPNA